jgi:hypothetical protein
LVNALFSHSQASLYPLDVSWWCDNMGLLVGELWYAAEGFLCIWCISKCIVPCRYQGQTGPIHINNYIASLAWVFCNQYIQLIVSIMENSLYSL